jgi:hypothetical protein
MANPTPGGGEHGAEVQQPGLRLVEGEGEQQQQEAVEQPHRGGGDLRGAHRPGAGAAGAAARPGLRSEPPSRSRRVGQAPTDLGGEQGGDGGQGQRPEGPASLMAPSRPRGAASPPASTPIQARRPLAATSARGSSSATGSSECRAMAWTRENTSSPKATGNSSHESCRSISATASTARAMAASDQHEHAHGHRGAVQQATEQRADEGEGGDREQQVQRDVAAGLRGGDREEQGAGQRDRDQRVVGGAGDLDQGEVTEAPAAGLEQRADPGGDLLRAESARASQRRAGVGVGGLLHGVGSGRGSPRDASAPAPTPTGWPRTAVGRATL